MISLNLIFDENLIKTTLKEFNSPSRISMREKDFIKSAVLFLIVPYNDTPYDLVLIRRTKRKNDKHGGEMSFPGGRFDAKLDKTFLDTALRETEEELGIPKSKIILLGCLDDHITPKGFIITPFVGYVDEYQKMEKQDEEVKEIVRIPIEFFANKKNYKETIYKLKNDLLGVGKFNYIAPNKENYVIFGATSHIIVNYIDRVYNLGLMTPGVRRLRPEDINETIVK